MKKCIYHDVELKPTAEIFKFTDEQREAFRKIFGFNLPIQQEFVCMKCGQLYDKDFRKMKLKLRIGEKNDRSTEMPQL